MISFVLIYVPFVLEWEISVQVILTTIMAFFAGSMALYSAWTFWKRIPRKERLEVEEIEKILAVLKEKQDRMRGEYASYRNLMVTRYKELMLKGEDEKKEK